MSMNADTAELRRKQRRVKDHILTKYLTLADKEGKEPFTESESVLYKELTLTFARNVIPRSQEITGEDGEAIQVSLVKYADNPITPPVPTEDVSASAS